ncbi:MAG: hypothetical protein AAGH15_21085 [Myxococcota bacterium]
MLGDYVPLRLQLLLPPLTLGLMALHGFAVSIALLLAEPGEPVFMIMAAMMAAHAALALYAAKALRDQAFWARGYALGLLALASLGLCPGAPFFGVLFVPGEILVLLLLIGDAPAARFEQRPAFRKETGLGPEGARRVFRTSLGMGLGIGLLLGSPLGFLFFMQAPGGSLAAAALALVGFVGFVRLKTWASFALGAALAVLVAAVLWLALPLKAAALPLALAFGVAFAPLAGPLGKGLREVWRPAA